MFAKGVDPQVENHWASMPSFFFKRDRGLIVFLRLIPSSWAEATILSQLS